KGDVQLDGFAGVDAGERREVVAKRGCSLNRVGRARGDVATTTIDPVAGAVAIGAYKCNGIAGVIGTVARVVTGGEGQRSGRSGDLVTPREIVHRHITLDPTDQDRVAAISQHFTHGTEIDGVARGGASSEMNHDQA